MRRSGLIPVLMTSVALALCACATKASSRHPTPVKVSSAAPSSNTRLAPLVEYGASSGFGSGGVHTVLASDTLWTIAKQYKLPMRDIIDANNLTPPYHLAPGARLQLPPPQTYKIKNGDNLPLVAKLFSVSQHDLIALNNISSPYRLVVGQDLRLPRPQLAVLVPVALPPVPVMQARLASPAPVSQSNDFGASVRAAAARDQIDPTVSAPQPVVFETMSPREGISPSAIPSVNVATTASDIRPPQLNVPSSVQPVSLPPSVMPDVPARSGGRFLQPVNGQVISRYGGKSDGLFNEGVNIAAPRGSSVRAAENGTVVYVGRAVEGYGNLILVKHADGYITAYAHMDKTLATVGQVVKRGQPIGTVGSTGNVARAQLHFEVRKGRDPIDPLTVI